MLGPELDTKEWQTGDTTGEGSVSAPQHIYIHTRAEGSAVQPLLSHSGLDPDVQLPAERTWANHTLLHICDVRHSLGGVGDALGDEV